MAARICFVVLVLALPATAKRKEVSFPSEDGLKVTADLYGLEDSGAPMIVLFHQANWSRGEYREIAPKLNAMGFACLAVDQRSGREAEGVVNETAKRAREKELGTERAYGVAHRRGIPAKRAARRRASGAAAGRGPLP